MEINEDKNKMPDFSFESKLWLQELVVAGIDEAGRGPLAGPVVASSVIFKPDCQVNPKINDSKKICQYVREELFDWIRNNTIVGIGVVDVVEIEKINILNATFEAMKLSIENLIQKPDFLLIDGNRFKEYGYKFQTIIKGDSVSYSIAAASIIAKVTRDRIMNEFNILYPEYGFDKHKGYATKLHFEAIDKYGICDIHRKSFLKKHFSKQYSLLW